MADVTDITAVRRKWRGAVFARDVGLCAACGCPTESVRVWIETALCILRDWHPEVWTHWRQRDLRVELLTLCDFDPQEPSLWEADHITPLADGGGDTLANLQTLCHDCHKQKSAGEAGPRAKMMRLREKRPGKKYNSAALARLHGKAL